ncbi:MAG: hypothetical protein AB9866_03490 [Syntrophobacteraceae bacterium]
MECCLQGISDLDTLEAAPICAAQNGLPRKHACPDCHFCQLCSDSRCHSCRSQKAEGDCPKLSLSEQIRLYDEINANDPAFRKKRT